MHPPLNCTAHAILDELKQAAKRNGFIIDPTPYPYLDRLLTASCDCPGSHHAEEVLTWHIRSYIGAVKFPDGFTIPTTQARDALEHHFFGRGSLDSRRNHIVRTILDIDTDDKTSPKYRKGWEVGNYRKTKEDALLWPFAKHLASVLYAMENPADPEFDFSMAEQEFPDEDEAA